jgi:hypothetical protein
VARRREGEAHQAVGRAPVAATAPRRPEALPGPRTRHRQQAQSRGRELTVRRVGMPAIRRFPEREALLLALRARHPVQRVMPTCPARELWVRAARVMPPEPEDMRQVPQFPVPEVRSPAPQEVHLLDLEALDTPHREQGRTRRASIPKR